MSLTLPLSHCIIIDNVLMCWQVRTWDDLLQAGEVQSGWDPLQEGLEHQPPELSDALSHRGGTLTILHCTASVPRWAVVAKRIWGHGKRENRLGGRISNTSVLMNGYYQFLCWRLGWKYEPTEGAIVLCKLVTAVVSLSFGHNLNRLWNVHDNSHTILMSK